MTDTSQPGNPRPQHTPSVGETGGLPGSNAAPQNSELSDDEKADTVSALGPVGAAPTDDSNTSATGNG